LPIWCGGAPKKVPRWQERNRRAQNHSTSSYSASVICLLASDEPSNDLWQDNQNHDRSGCPKQDRSKHYAVHIGTFSNTGGRNLCTKSQPTIPATKGGTAAAPTRPSLSGPAPSHLPELPKATFETPRSTSGLIEPMKTVQAQRKTASGETATTTGCLGFRPSFPFLQDTEPSCSVPVDFIWVRLLISVLNQSVLCPGEEMISLQGHELLYLRDSTLAFCYSRHQ
jgi:hypothetical protein